MMAMNASSSSSFSSSYPTQTLFVPKCISSSSSASSPTALRHEWCTTKKLDRTKTSLEQKPLFAPLDFRTTKHMLILIQCRSSSSSSSFDSFTQMDRLFSFFQEIGLDEKETEILFDKNPTLKFTALESLRSRIHSLRTIGIDVLALYRLITKRPDILTAQELEPFLCFIRDRLDGEIKPLKLERLLTVTNPQFFVGFTGKVRLLLDHGIPPEKLAHVLNNVNLAKVFCHKSAEEIEKTIHFLDRFGGVDLIVRRPSLLNMDLESQLIPRIGFLTELSGGDEIATGAVLRKLPAVLTYTLEHLQGHAEYFRSFIGLNNQQIFKIVLVYPNIFSVSKQRKLHPRTEFLKQCGLDSEDIFKFLIKAPLFLSLSFEENLSKKLGFLVKMGYKDRTKELAVAMGAVTRTSCENMQKIIGVFLNYGLSCEDILVMSKRHPQILQYNNESLEKKVEYLIEGMDREVGELLSFPAFLGYKLDDRIKPRYEVKKKIIGEGMSLNKLLSVSTERFLKTKLTTNDTQI